MWMANIAVVLIILGCAAYQYKRGTLVKSFSMIIIVICASIVAFSYFEILANVFISRGDNTRYPSLVPWAQSLCFMLLFVLVFAILQTIVGRLTRQPIDLGIWPERIGRAVCGIFLGIILSGILLTALAMAPLSNKYPYQRFDPARPDPENPNKVLFNADGFATGWFSVVSRGSFSTLGKKRSFAVLHPAFLDQVFLNRHNIADDVPIITCSNAIELPKKKAAWPAPEGLKDAENLNKPVEPKMGHSLTIVRVGIKSKTVKDAGKFTLSQLRLVCKQKTDVESRFGGKGKNIYPIGYLRTPGQLQRKRLNDQIIIELTDSEGTVKWIDFAFYLPDDSLPVLVEFKQNSIAEVPSPVSVDQAPAAVSFIPTSRCAKDIAELQPIASAEIYGAELATGTKFLAGLTLKISDANQWQSAQTARSIKPAQFQDGQISYVRAELKTEKPAQEDAKADEIRTTTTRRYRPQKYVKKSEGAVGMLKPLDGYTLLSLKCNNPSVGTAIEGDQLPVLIESSGLIHHPVGVIVSGNVGSQTLYEVDYCAITAEDDNGLIITEDGSVAQPFPNSIWLSQQVQTISEFYVLYLVKSGRNAIIISVQPADSHPAAVFKEYEGFLIK